MIKFFKNKNNKGSLLLGVVFFSAIGITLVSAFVGWSVALFKTSKNVFIREQAFMIAEAGVDYYRWHLAHDQDDFQDGTGQAGPYVHEYLDKDGVAIGTFSLDITPPPTGSTVVTIRSTGSVYENPEIERTIEVKLAIPSFAKWAVVANADMRFGEGTEMYGPVHSNGGIRFDGIAYNTVTSSKTSYDDPDHEEVGAEKLEHGVHTHVKPPPLTGSYTNYVPAETPPSSLAVRNDVFVAGREVSVPAVDFVGITSDLSSIKSQAQASGHYLASSGSQGYRIVFKTNDTYDVYRVTRLQAQGSCNAPSGISGQDGWGTWSIRSSNGQTLLGNYAIPSNGLIFVEDHVWVEGQINTARVTLASGSFPDNVSNRKSITVNNDLSYTNYDGSDVISLIAQNNINVGMVSDTNLRIDAALIAQNGRVGRYYYGSSCSPYNTRSSITLFGMIGTNQRYGFSYTDGTGYDDRYITYDSNLLYSPPPSFPLTSDAYSTISWREIKN